MQLPCRPCCRRTRRVAVGLALGYCLSAGPATAVPPVPSAEIQVAGCLITALDDVQVPARRAGLVQQFEVKEGDHAAKHQVVARLDDEEAVMQLESAQAELDTAEAKAESDCEVRHAEVTRESAAEEYKISHDIHAKQPGAISLIELVKLRLAVDQAALGITGKQSDLNVRRTEIGVTAAKAKLAATDVKRHTIMSPLDGEIAEIYVQQGEWIEAGKPVMRIVRLDRLRVEGFVKMRDALPADVFEQSVQVRVELARQQFYEFQGRITFVSPLVEAGGEYRVWAEVENRRERNQWLLRPGLQGEMTIER